MKAGDRIRVISEWSNFKGRCGVVKLVDCGVYFVDLGDGRVATGFNNIPFGFDELESE